MPDSRRRNPAPRRRRRDEEDGEDSIAGEGEDFSMSEGSVISTIEDEADAEGSDVSGEEDDASIVATQPTPQPQRATNRFATNGRPVFGSFVATPDTEAMLKGLKSNDSTKDRESQPEETTTVEAIPPSESQPDPLIDNSIVSHTETLAQRSKREHLEYIKQKNSNPAFVPNRGGFFLHDDRSSTQTGPLARPFRGRGRGLNTGYGIGRGYVPAVPEMADRQWAHDLHDTVNKSLPTPPIRATPASVQIPTAKPASTPPNRSFSVTTVLGNVSVQLYIPGMDDKKTVSNIVKRQHTLLPQHRPPLRRDKPVRISLPDEHPRYIFPSTERSFIFIPRALRPNQQSYPRGRGRGSFQGSSRRPSVFGGSVYSPSVGMSRKSSISIGTGVNGLQTPTTSGFNGTNFPSTVNRPVVRMPVVGYPVAFNQPQPPISHVYTGDRSLASESGTPGPTILHSPPVAIPMHQPRPQKTVSVAGIESPAFNPPQQQHEQPFHQQVPQGVGMNDKHGSSLILGQPGTSAGTPLSHIPEGAVYAQPFQPYPLYPQAGFYGAPYTGGHMFYPPGSEAMTYGMVMGGPVVVPQFATGSRPASFARAASSGDNTSQPSTVAHESNGMVFYYDQAQFPSDTTPQYPVTQSSGLVAMPNNPYIYSPMHSGMYYPPPTGQ